MYLLNKHSCKNHINLKIYSVYLQNVQFGGARKTVLTENHGDMVISCARNNI